MVQCRAYKQTCELEKRRNMQQKRIFIPSNGPESWKALLSDPEKHWRTGYSAYSTAYSWEEAEGLPSEIENLFKKSDQGALQDASLAFAVPEYMVPLAGGSKPSQNDVFALVSCAGGLVSMMVEGKARESFDVPLEAWIRKTSPSGAEARLNDLIDNLGLQASIPKTIHYQLLHRTASAVIEAKKFHAPYAVMIVQSFEPNDELNHYNDFTDFVKLYGKETQKERLIYLTTIGGIQLYTAWVQSTAR